MEYDEDDQPGELADLDDVGGSNNVQELLDEELDIKTSANQRAWLVKVLVRGIFCCVWQLKRYYDGTGAAVFDGEMAECAE